MVCGQVKTCVKALHYGFQKQEAAIQVTQLPYYLLLQVHSTQLHKRTNGADVQWPDIQALLLVIASELYKLK